MLHLLYGVRQLYASPLSEKPIGTILIEAINQVINKALEIMPQDFPIIKRAEGYYASLLFAPHRSSL